jgi:hypothetical protein
MAEQLVKPSFENVVRNAVLAERERCIKIVCQYCAAGNQPDDKGWHALEMIQGHVYHEAMCSAVLLRKE